MMEPLSGPRVCSKWGRSTRLFQGGFTGFLIVLTLLAVAGVMLVSQSVMTRGLHHQAVATLAGANALATVQWALRDAFAQVCRAASDPNDRSFAGLRRQLVQSKTPTTDLSSLLSIDPKRSALQWTRERSSAKRPIGEMTLESVRCTVEQLVPVPDTLTGSTDRGSPDEKTGLVRFQSRAAVRLAGRTVRRELSEYREIKVVLAGPPRPFDGVGLYLRDLQKVTDPVKANLLRDKILAALDQTKSELSSLKKALLPDVQKEMESIYNGLPKDSNRERMVPRLPEGPAVLVGLSFRGSLDFSALDLAARLQDDFALLSSVRVPFQQAVRAAENDGGRQLLKETIELIKAFNRALMRLWIYQREFRLVARDGLEFAKRIGPYEERLTPVWFVDRTLADLDPSGPLYSDWLAGRRALSGVFRVRSSGPMTLSGCLFGRAVLVVDTPELTLKDLDLPRDQEDLLTIVCCKGTVKLSGTVRVQLIVSGEARVEPSEGSQLTGSLLFSGERLSLTKSSKLVRDATGFSGASLEQSLSKSGRGAYAVGISPVPLWVRGDRP